MTAPRATEAHDTVDVYELPQLETEIPAEWRFAGASRRLTRDACPLCRLPNPAAGLVGRERAHPPRIFPLPRSRRARVCPDCERMLFAELPELAQNGAPRAVRRR